MDASVVADKFSAMNLDVLDVLEVVGRRQRVGDAGRAGATGAADAVDVIVRMPRRVDVEDVANDYGSGSS